MNCGQQSKKQQDHDDPEAAGPRPLTRHLDLVLFCVGTTTTWTRRRGCRSGCDTNTKMTGKRKTNDMTMKSMRQRRTNGRSLRPAGPNENIPTQQQINSSRLAAASEQRRDGLPNSAGDDDHGGTSLRAPNSKSDDLFSPLKTRTTMINNNEFHSKTIALRCSRLSAGQLLALLLLGFAALLRIQSSQAFQFGRLRNVSALSSSLSSSKPNLERRMLLSQPIDQETKAREQQQQQQQVSSGDEARSPHWSLPNRPSLFSIIRFPNEECFDSSNQSGTCYTAFECKLLGGQPSSPCAAGFGSCCIVSRTCHVTTREKVVYFKNPSYPSADSDEKFCDLTVEMGDINVCQLRLDFLDFQLDPPTNGACKDDYMEISASGMPPQTVPRLCGLNRNQHLYINVPQDLHERSASIVFYTDPVGDHRWQVKVTQIDCNHYKPIDWKRQYAKFATSPLWNPHPNGAGAGLRLPLHLAGAGKYSTTFASGFQTMSQTASALAYEFLKPQFTPRAPMGCLQYFTQPSGIIESFNFGQYLNNMDYSICIQRQSDTCRIVFTSSDYDWSLNGVGVSGSSSGVGDQDCARDYLLIPGASRTGDGFTYDRYCGGRLHYYRGQSLSAPVVIKTSGPIVLRFHSDAHFEGLNNGGFRLQYDQSAQDCIYHTPEEAGSLASQQIVASTLADSRPLNSLVHEAPVLYAAQQLNSAPVLQQLSHIELEDSSHHSSSSGGQSAIKPPLDLNSDPNRRPQSTLSYANQLSAQTNKPLEFQAQQLANESGALDSASSNNNLSPLTQHQQQQSFLASGENIKRADHGLSSSNYQLDAGGGDSSSWLGQRRRQANRNSNRLQLADLSKAFELISSRSARWLH